MLRPGARSLGLVCALGLAAWVVPPAAIAVDLTVGDINQETALRIGAHRVSHYLVNKYYGRFADGIRQREQRPPSAAESQAWLELFFARQVLIAHVGTLGYLERPDVVQIVNRMERHMLAQPDPLGLRSSALATGPSADRLQDVQQRAQAITDAIVARFDDEAAMIAGVGADFLQAPVGEQTRRLVGARGGQGIEVVDGPLAWPYAPFSEIEGTIATAPVGRVVMHRDPVLGVYLVLVRGVTPRPGNVAPPAASLRQFVRDVEQQVAQRKESGARLVAASFSCEPGTISRAIELWRTLPSSELPAPPDPATGKLPLARYQADGQPVVVSLDDFRAHFNELFVRRIPRQPAELRQAAGELVLAALNRRAARNAGIDRTPQFMEDRRGFAGFQALDVFERQVLEPRVTVSEAEIASYHREHPAEFQRVTRVRGRWLEFSTAADASRWLLAGDAAGGAVAPVADRLVELDADAPLAGTERFQRDLFAGPAGARVGPFPFGLVQVVFVKEADLERGATPLAEVAATIRRDLVRRALDRRELELAAELSARFEIEDHLDYARYGVTRQAPKLSSNR